MLSTGRSTPTQSQDTLEDALINRIADLYRDLVGGFREIVRDQLKRRNIARLRSEARESWRRTLDYLQSKGQHPDLIVHIQDQMLPLIETEDLSRSIFAIFFFNDERTQMKRAWCPRDAHVLSDIGFPYSAVRPVTEGLPGIPGLSRWAVPLSDKKRKGVRGDLRHQHCANLTELQFRQQVYVPEGDWLIGIKSVIFLGVPVRESDHSKRVGQICICSPIPNLFGRRDLWENNQGASSFFRPYLESVPQVVEKDRPFCEVFQDCVRYRQTSANRLAEAWMFQTVGLTHKHRDEAEEMNLQWCLPVERFLDFADKSGALQPIIEEFNRLHQGNNTTAQTLLNNLAMIRSSVDGQRRFYEFLSHYSYRCQQDLGLQSSLVVEKLRKIDLEMERDEKRRITYESLSDFQTHIAELTSLISLFRRGFGPLEWEPANEWHSIGPFPERGAIEYIFYELLENAEKRKPNASSIRCSAHVLSNAERKDMLCFSITNEIRIVPVKARRCDQCGKSETGLRRFRTMNLCDHCLPNRVKSFFEQGDCWWPQKTGSFGLFMIKQFVEQFYEGSLLAKSVRRGSAYEITFYLELPMHHKPGPKGEQHNGQYADSRSLLR